MWGTLATGPPTCTGSSDGRGVRIGFALSPLGCVGALVPLGGCRFSETNHTHRLVLRRFWIRGSVVSSRWSRVGCLAHAPAVERMEVQLVCWASAEIGA